MRIENVRLHNTGACLLLAIATSFSTVARAEVGDWTSGGPYGGGIDALAIDPKTPSTLYAGALYGGVFKSTDSGATWATAIAGLTSLSVHALAIDPATPSTLYAGTASAGVFKSTNAGATWVAANEGLTNSYIVSLAVNPATPSTLYAGTQGGGVFRSTDSGLTWGAANVGLTDTSVYALAIDPRTPSRLYAAGLSAVFRSTDSGATWRALTGVGARTLAIDPLTPTTLYKGSTGVYKSTDSGESWTAAGAELRYQDIYALAIDPGTPSTLYAGAAGSGYGPAGSVFKSTDGGATWTAASTGVQDSFVYALAIDPARPATLYAGMRSGGIFRSMDSGGAWTASSTGLAALYTDAIAVDPSTPTTLYAGTAEGVFRSTDSGTTWTARNAGLTSSNVRALAIDPSTPATLYAATTGNIFRSTDSGVTWAATNDGPGWSGLSALVIDPKTPSTLYAGTSAVVWKSTDAGVTWSPVVHASGSGMVLAIDPVTPSTVYAATSGGIFKSTDSGATWTGNGAVKEVQSLAIDPAAPSKLYAGTVNRGLFRSTDGGRTWVAATTGLTSLWVTALAVNPAISSTIYAGTNTDGVFRSTNSGLSWSAISTGLPWKRPGVPAVSALAVPSGGTKIFAGLSTGGIWQCPLPPFEVIGSAGFVPIVLDVAGLAHYTSELQLTNLGAGSATVKLTYTSSIGSGSGDVTETVPAGQQVVYPDAISFLRSRNVPIPVSGNQGGTLLLSAPSAGVHATVRTSADTVAPQPVGRAGLAYAGTDPTSSSTASKVFVYGLRTNDTDRSNLAVYNMSKDPVSLRVILVSGDDGSSFEVTSGGPLVLPAYGWYQYSGVRNATGLASGYAVVERVSGSGPFGAYGVVNDQLTNDGSFIPALSGTQGASKLTVPVLVETSAFESELILANRDIWAAEFTLRYVESLSPGKGPGGTTTVRVPAGRQLVISKAIDFLRSNLVRIGARGEASYAGSLQVQVGGVNLEYAFVGARTSSLSPAGGQFGLFYPAVDSSEEASDLAFVLGLKADVNNRSNVAVLHTGDAASGPITLELQVLDGSEGGKAVGPPLPVTLTPGQWAQPAGFFASGGVPNGYVRIRRTAGTAPWYAYGVINDGASPGQRTGDGAYVPMVK